MYDDDNIDAVKYLHDLYYGELNFLKTKQELLRDIIDNVDSSLIRI